MSYERPYEPMSLVIPESEVQLSYATSGGPGGQNVNKVATKAVLRWNPMESTILTDDQKARIMEVLSGRITKSGDIVIHANEHRSQEQNKRAGFERLQRIVVKALAVDKERIGTKPTRGSMERRIDDKKREGAKKKARSWRPE